MSTLPHIVQAPKECPGPELCAPVANTGWHLKKEIQLGHLLTMITMIASVALYVTKMDQRLAVVESALTHQQSRDARQDADAAQSDSLIRAQLSRMDEKLDRVIDKLGGVGRR